MSIKPKMRKVRTVGELPSHRTRAPWVPPAPPPPPPIPLSVALDLAGDMSSLEDRIVNQLADEIRRYTVTGRAASRGPALDQVPSMARLLRASGFTERGYPTISNMADITERMRSANMHISMEAAARAFDGLHRAIADANVSTGRMRTFMGMPVVEVVNLPDNEAYIVPPDHQHVSLDIEAGISQTQFYARYLGSVTYEELYRTRIPEMQPAPEELQDGPRCVVNDRRQREAPHARFLADNQRFQTRGRRR